jgi:hypothetical protein
MCQYVGIPEEHQEVHEDDEKYAVFVWKGSVADMYEPSEKSPRSKKKTTCSCKVWEGGSLLKAILEMRRQRKMGYGYVGLSWRR